MVSYSVWGIAVLLRSQFRQLLQCGTTVAITTVAMQSPINTTRVVDAAADMFYYDY